MARAHTILFTSLLTTFAPLLRGQDVENPYEHVLEISLVDAGRRAPRLPDQAVEEGQDPAPFRIVDHRVAWQLGTFRTEDRGKLSTHLKAIAAKSEEWAADPSLPTMRVAAADDVYWADVVATRILVSEAGLAELMIDRKGQEIWMAKKSIRYPVREQGGIVVPESMWSIPDEDEPGYWRPTLVIRQDGRTEYRGRTLFDATKPGERTTRLAKTLRELAKQAKERYGTTKLEKRRGEFLQGRILLHADKWARWSDLTRVVEIAGKNKSGTFFQFDVAATEFDLESELLRGRKFDRNDAPTANEDR